MSHENVEWVRQVAEVWARGDEEALKALFQARLAPDSELHPLYLDHRGYEGMRELWADLGEAWEEYRVETEEIVDLGEHVLLLAHITGRGTASGVPIDQPLALLWAFEGEKAVWAKSFPSKQDALEAAGLRE
jgi:ketosteroid isomerase-like protein